MIELLSTLINIPSVTGSESHIGHVLVQDCERRGYRVTRQAVQNERFNILATTDRSPRVLFCTHMDTVAPFLPARREGERLYGRGACDAKGQIAAMLEAGERLRAAAVEDFGFLFVVGEELVSDGAKTAARLEVDCEHVILGEPTDNRLAIGQKGVLVFEVRAEGTGGHSSQPENGTSAVHALLDFLAMWRRRDWGADETLGANLVNIGLIEGGDGINILAHHARAKGIMRVATPPAKLRPRLFENVPDGIEVEILSESPPQRFDPVDGFETMVAGFGTDAAYLRPLGRVHLIGPGSIQVAHRANEHIELADLYEAVDVYIRLVRRLLK